MGKAKPKAGKAGTYGKNKSEGKAKLKAKKPSMKAKKTTKPVQKSLVSKELMEVIKEKRKEKQDSRKQSLSEKKAQKGKKRKIKDTPKEPAEPLKKKQLKKLRKSNDNDDYENIMKIKKVWEKARKNTISKAEKLEYIIELKGMMKGKVESLMFKHDLARVVQMILKHGTSEHNDFIIEELKPHIVELSKSKYGKFTVNCMLKNSTKAQRNTMFRCFSGNFKKLAVHADAVSVVDTFYNEYATSNQRTEIITEFYGKDLYLYRDLLSEHLSKVLESHPQKKDSILAELHKFSTVFIDKGLTGYIITQHLILQYVLHASAEQIHELISDKLIEQLVNFVHTKEGSKITMRSIWFGSAKHRKNILKTFKGHVKDMCTNENGYLVLLAVFDAVDDTVMVRKVILSEILENLDTIVMSSSGRSVINYLLQPRGKQCHPLIIEMLKPGDGNAFSKKESAVRSSELLACIASGLVSNFAANTESMLLDNATALLLSTAAMTVPTDVTPILQELAQLCSADHKFVEGITSHVTLRNLLSCENTRKRLSELLIDILDTDMVKVWVSSNRGCFTLLRIIEHGEADNHDKLLEELKKISFKAVSTSVGRDKLVEFLKK